jgi:hypothetical protein
MPNDHPGSASPSSERPAEPTDDGGWSCDKCGAYHNERPARVSQPSPGGSGEETTEAGRMLATFLAHSLKPNEISGPGRERRVAELLRWFERHARGEANPTWFERHAFELAYALVATRLSGGAAPCDGRFQNVQDCEILKSGAPCAEHSTSSVSAPRPQEGEAAALTGEEATPITDAEIAARIAELERSLRPHREWGGCPMTGEEECCDTLVIELRLLRRVAARLASPLPPRDERPLEGLAASAAYFRQSAAVPTGCVLTEAEIQAAWDRVVQTATALRLPPSVPLDFAREIERRALRAASPRPGAEATSEDERDEWLTEQVHRGEGVLTLGLTEHGTVGLWLPGNDFPEAYCDGSGDSAIEAIDRARSARSSSGSPASEEGTHE